MVVESTGMLFLFPRSDFQNPRLANFESCEHKFGNECKVERYSTVDSLLQIKEINRRKNRAMYESDLKMHQYGNKSGY